MPSPRDSTRSASEPAAEGGRSIASLPAGVLALAAVLQLVFVAQATWAARRDSVTIDELVGLPVGLYTLYTGDRSPATMNPPFFRAFEALPLLVDPPRVDLRPSTNHWELGYRFMWQNAPRYHEMYVVCRLMVVIAAAGLGALLFHWAFHLYGWPTGLVVLFLYTFAPSVLTHGHLITLDLAGAIGFTATLYATWRFLGHPSRLRAAGVGLLLGVSPLLKISNLTLYPAVAAVVAMHLAKTRGRQLRAADWLVRGTLVAIAALVTLNALYGFDRTFGPSGETVPPENRTFHALDAWVPLLRVFFPVPFLKSVDLVVTGDQPIEPTYFLGGELSPTGWWYYHLLAFALKEPLPLIAAALVALGLWVLARGGSAERREYCLHVPILWLFLGNALTNPLNIGVRHTFPALPLLLIAAGALLARPFEALAAGRRDARALGGLALSAAALAWMAAGTLAVAPRYLQYFNELAGGPERGHRWLIDSNVDWGQDLVRLAEWLEGRNGETVHLAYFGRVDPVVYGIRFEPLERETRGLAVVSASFLMGRPYSYWRRPGEIAWASAGAFTWLQERRPIARVGALFVYDLR